VRLAWGWGAKLCTAFLALFAAAIIVISAIFLDRTQAVEMMVLI
jgi:hypothetical protein